MIFEGEQMKRQKLAGLLILLLLQACAISAELFVPWQYSSISMAVDAAQDGDNVTVFRGTYSGDIDLSGKNITVRSADPNDPDIVAQTIIDCNLYPIIGRTRAFTFGDNTNSAGKVMGFTIINALAGYEGEEGEPGMDGEEPDEICQYGTYPTPGDPGKDVFGDGLGGAIYCGAGTRPTIYKCVIKDSVASAGIGGKGGAGGNAVYEFDDVPCAPDDCDPAEPNFGCDEDPNLCDPGALCPVLIEDPCNPGTWLNVNIAGEGGKGGDSIGFGRGGAIYCGENSRPVIESCIMINNMAKGPEGGQGGDAGESYGHGSGAKGGDGGLAEGGSQGGAIYCANGSVATILNCEFIDNMAFGLVGGAGGAGGDANDEQSWEGDGDFPPAEGGHGGIGGDADGPVQGGAIYIETTARPIIAGCLFKDSDISPSMGGMGGPGGAQPEDTPEESLEPDLDHDGFLLEGPPGYILNNLYYGGAIFYEGGGVVDISDSRFENNRALFFGGAIYLEPNCRGVISDSDFEQNIAQQLSSFEEYQLVEDYPLAAVYTTLPDEFVGGAIDCNDFVDLDLNRCAFTANHAGALDEIDIYGYSGFYYDIPSYGGAINAGRTHKPALGVTLNMSGCQFGGNSCDNDGGAISMRSVSGAMCSLNFADTTLSYNTAKRGAGLFTDAVDIDMQQSYVIGNTAEESGGGLYFINNTGVITLNEVLIRKNEATTFFGGGIMSIVTSPTISHCDISDNKAGETGGAIMFLSDSGVANPILHDCLFTKNSAYFSGGAIACEYAATPQIGNCTFSTNWASPFGGRGGAVYCNYNSDPVIQNSIFDDCRKIAIYEQDQASDAAVSHNLFFRNTDGHFYDYDTLTVYSDVAGLNGIDPGVHDNIQADPQFVPGYLGDYYLSQVAAGQHSNSPAVNAGNNTAANLNLNTRTTRTDSHLPKPTGDAGIVDLGYHYIDTDDAPTFQLTLSVDPASDGLPHGDLLPGTGLYPAGAVVTLTADPDTGWRIKKWSGTDNDVSTDLTNEIVMNSDRNISVRFEQARTFTVAVGGGQQGYFSNIQDAIHEAQDRDVIVVHPGIYRGPEIQINKSVTLRSLHPDDPCNVAATIIDREGYANRAFRFTLGGVAARDAVLDGFTIRNCRWFILPGLPGDTCVNGGDGYGAEGGAIYVSDGFRPTFKNCVFANNYAEGANGGDGGDCDCNVCNAGRGGWGGWAYGGAIFCDANSAPTFINCKFIDNTANGGTGGNGGDCSDGLCLCEANYGGNWSRAEWFNLDSPVPSMPICGAMWEEGDLWEAWNRVGFMTVGEEQVPVAIGGYIGDYRWYSAYGGAVFCGEKSNAKFTNCTFRGNRTYGGMSGAGGDRPGDNPEPEFPYELPSFGGAVYSAADANVVFTDCVFEDNIASEWSLSDVNDPESGRKYHIDPYVGHGGGVCAEDTARVVFKSCRFDENIADSGGALHWATANPRVVDCNFISNKALIGGGMYGMEGPGTIIGSSFVRNRADSAIYDINDIAGVSDPNFYALERTSGTGGGLHLWEAAVDIVDSYIGRNFAETSGGGLYFGGSNTSRMSNCLVVKNTAVRDGAGISSNIYAQLMISNSTIADNRATGLELEDSYGGGLFTSYESLVKITDSILWGNFARSGRGIAVTTGFEFDVAPSEVQVSYSNVQGSAAGVYVDIGDILDTADDSTLIWGPGNLAGTPLSDPCFVSIYTTDINDLDPNVLERSYYLSQPDVYPPDPNQIKLSPCVDAGSDDAHALGLYRHTTRTDRILDTGRADMGFHYMLTSDLVGDFNYDFFVDTADLDRFNMHWLDDACIFPDWCHGKDLNEDSMVDYADYALFSANYGLTETTPPKPNPMTWQTPPMWIGGGTVYMAATEAYDNSSGPHVEYYFECVYGNCHDRVWDPCSTFTDTGLSSGQQYGYMVTARDASVNLNETLPSYVGYVIVGDGSGDDVPPEPDPMSWAVMPYAVSASSIQMTATTADDFIHSVEYYFENITIEGHDSGWQTGASFTDTGLDPETTYTYRVKARDTSPWNNETKWSEEAAATTMEEGEEPPPPPPPDHTPPAPNPTITSALQQLGLDGNYHHVLTASEATDESGVVEYFFECYTNGAFSSGWIAANTYDVAVGRYQHTLVWRVRARDASGNMTPWSGAVQVSR